MLLTILFVVSILAGQTVKFPVFNGLGPALLDFYILLFVIYGLFKVRNKIKKPPPSLTSGFVFAAVALISLLLTPLHLNLFEYFVAFLYTLRFALYITAGWIIYLGAFENFKKMLPTILLISGAGLAIFGLLQFIFLPDLKFLQEGGWDPHYFRTVSTFLDPNFLGAYLVLTLLLIIPYFQNKNIFIRRIFYLIFAIVYLALLTTFSRSSYGMFLISFLVLSFLKRSIKLVILSSILFVFLVFSFQVYIQKVNMVTPLDRNETASMRFYTWQQGLNIFQKNPILGIGFNAYNFALRHYQLGDEQFLAGKGSTFNDSSLLHVLSTTGILGFCAYSSFLFGLLKTKNYTLIAAIPGLLAHSFFVNSLFYPFILIWIILSLNISYAKQPVK